MLEPNSPKDLSENLPPDAPNPHRSVSISDAARVNIQGDLFTGDKIIGYTAAQLKDILVTWRAHFQPKSFEGPSPYVGLASFEEEDAIRFFGREHLTTELVERVAHARAIFITGPSGMGKSSLVCAGLIPYLKGDKRTGSDRWLFTPVIKPGREPLANLGRAVAKAADSLNARSDIEQKGLQDPTILHQWLDTALGDKPHQRAVLFIDQFEEIFTQLTYEDEAERLAFFNLLAYAATVPNGRTTILFGLRSDFISNLAAYPNLNALVNREFLQVGELSEDELARAVTLPAARGGLPLDPKLVDQILHDMRGQTGALPLMQFLLNDLFESQRAKGGVVDLRLEDYLQRDGLHEALGKYADSEFNKLSDEEQEIARSVFTGLVEPGQGKEHARRTAYFQELVPARTDPAQVRNVIAKLANARLITAGEEDNINKITLAHESLIHAWTWLRHLVNENREAIALKNQITDDAQEWEEHARDISYLYTGARLAAVQGQLEQKKIPLSEPVKEFVDAAVRSKKIGLQSKVTQRTAIILGITFVILVAFGLIPAPAFLLGVARIIMQVFLTILVMNLVYRLYNRGLSRTQPEILSSPYAQSLWIVLSVILAIYFYSTSRWSAATANPSNPLGTIPLQENLVFLINIVIVLIIGIVIFLLMWCGGLISKFLIKRFEAGFYTVLVFTLIFFALLTIFTWLSFINDMIYIGFPSPPN